jgi:hypothetical protein
MRLERHKKFLTPDECLTLNSWVTEAVKNKWVDVGISRGSGNYEKRFTSRLYGDRFEYPQIVRDISIRIRSFCGIDSYPLIEGHGRDGVVVSCTFDGGDVYKHKDPFANGGYSALRCNVMTSSPTHGGKLYVDGQHIDIDVGELHCYLASDFEHYVTEVQGETNRILWMFGAAVTKEDWELGKIKFNNPLA